MSGPKVSDVFVETINLATNLQALKLKENGIDEVVEPVRELGSGAYGSVWLSTLRIAIQAPNGTIINAGEHVAVKAIPLPDKENRAMLATEIEALKKAMTNNCRYVNQIYDVLYDSDEEEIYLIMEYIRGKDLWDMMVDKQGGRKFFAQQSEQYLIDAFINPLISGLNCLHRSGVAHRDIKVENMMFDQYRQEAIWIDLGLSCITQCFGTVGTPETFAPEVLHTTMGSDLESWIKADDWSLGSSIYYMIMAKDYPVQASSTRAWKEKRPYVPPDTVALDDFPGKFPRIRGLLENLLQPNPQNRLLPDAI